MSGYSLVKRIHSLEEECVKLGFTMCYAKQYHNAFGDVVAIKPKDQDSLPVYSRDAELFVGTLDGLEQWLKGIEWARRYDTMLFGSKHNERRIKKEQEHRNVEIFNIIKEDKKEEL